MTLSPSGYPLIVSVIHEPKEIASPGPHGGPSWLYRGVTIHSNPAKAVFAMEKPPLGLSGRWVGMGSLSQAQAIIDVWLDRQTLPLGYRSPGR